jgi:hypothetical protein
MTQEQLRMQMLAGVITESEYKAKLNEITPNTSKLFNKFWSEYESAKEINRRIKEMDDDVLLRIYNNEPVSNKLNTPRKIQVALIKKEIERRGFTPQE